MEKRAEDTSPCAIINIKAPLSPHFVPEKIAAATILMCPTEEYAIKAFKSVCRIHIILVIKAPQEQNTISTRERYFSDIVENREISRVSPYPPNFRRIAASIIDPATGASTCAFGSQR